MNKKRMGKIMDIQKNSGKIEKRGKFKKDKGRINGTLQKFIKQNN